MVKKLSNTKSKTKDLTINKYCIGTTAAVEKFFDMICLNDTQKPFNLNT